MDLHRTQLQPSTKTASEVLDGGGALSFCSASATAFSPAKARRRAIPTTRHWHFGYGIAVVLLAAVRVGTLTHQSLWFDEAYTLQLTSAASFRDFLQMFAGMTTSEHLQPLYYFCMFAWSRIFGTSDLALRIPSALFSIGSGVYLYGILHHLGRRVSPYYALLGISVFSLSSYSIYYAQEARPYACLQCCAFAVLYAWVARTSKVASGLTTQQQQHRLHLAVACTFALLSGVFGGLLVVCLAASDRLFGSNDGKSWWGIWRVSAICLTVTALMYVASSYLLLPRIVGADIVSVKQSLWMNAVYVGFGMLFGTTIGPSTLSLRSGSHLHSVVAAWPVLFPAALAAAALTFTAWKTLRNASIKAGKVFGFAATLYAMMLFLFFGFFGHLNILPRHASALFALLVVTVSTALVQGARDRNITRFVLMGALALAFVLNCFSVIEGMISPEYRKDDYRSVAQELSMEDDHSPIYLVSGSAILLQHYGLNTVSVIDTVPEQLSSRLLANPHSAEHIRVVSNSYRNYRWDGAPSVTQMLSASYLCRTDGNFSYFEVLSCSPRSNLPGNGATKHVR